MFDQSWIGHSSSLYFQGFYSWVWKALDESAITVGVRTVSHSHLNTPMSRDLSWSQYTPFITTKLFQPRAKVRLGFLIPFRCRLVGRRIGAVFDPHSLLSFLAPL